MKNKKGILIIPVLILAYFAVGTPEYKLEILEHSELNKVAQIEDIEAIFKKIETQMIDFEAELESMRYDDSIPLDYELQLHLKSECEKYEVDINEALAIMTVENSTFNPELVHKNTNGTTDVGLFQINSCNLRDFESMGFTNLKDPKENISYGVYFISRLDKYNGHEKYMAYNMGENGMKKAVSRGVSNTSYSRKVMELVK